MTEKAELISALEELSGSPITQKRLACGCDIQCRIDRGRVQDCARLLLGEGFYLSFVTAVDVSPACELVYQFGHFETSCRIIIRVSAGGDKTVPSIAHVYEGADWHEREIHEFFGIVFTGHPHLKPLILSREERDFRPLLKSDEQRKSADEIFPPQPAAGDD